MLYTNLFHTVIFKLLQIIFKWNLNGKWNYLRELERSAAFSKFPQSRNAARCFLNASVAFSPLLKRIFITTVHSALYVSNVNIFWAVNVLLFNVYNLRRAFLNNYYKYKMKFVLLLSLYVPGKIFFINTSLKLFII